MKKLIVLYGVCFVAMMFLSSPVMGAAYIKLDGVDGESTDANHDKWSDVLSVDHDFRLQETPGNNAVGRVLKNLGVEQVRILRVTTEMDKAVIYIIGHLLKGDPFSTAEIEFTATYGGARATYLRYVLHNAQVVSVSTNGSGNDEAGPPTVTYGLRFDKFDLIYTEYDDEGNNRGNHVLNW